MKKLTSRTKQFIISAILVYAVVIISALILITTNTIKFYSKGMLLYSGTLILSMIISAVFIRKRIRDNHKVISEKDIDLERYEEANDMLTFEVIKKKEKKHIINSIAEWLVIEKKVIR